MNLLKKSELLARKAYERQTRRGGEPYIGHCVRVVNSLKNIGITDEMILAAAWLHDVVEDKRMTYEELVKEVGYDVVSYVEFLDGSDMEYSKYIKRLKSCKSVIPIKIADIVDNLSSNPTEKQKEKYLRALISLTT